MARFSKGGHLRGGGLTGTPEKVDVYRVTMLGLMKSGRW